MTRPTKAVIPAAGLGTRMLPASSAFPKELLPIGTVPAFHFILEEVARAGIETVVVVNADWKSGLDNYLVVDEGLEDRVRGTEKEALLASIRSLRDRLDLVSIRQHHQRGLGHAIASAMPVVGDDPFAVLLPDEIILQGNGVTSELVAAAGDGGAIGLLEVPAEEVHRYGIAALDGPPPTPVTDLVEKPNGAEAPSRWAIVGRYVFPAGFRRALEDLRPGAGGELQLTDAMRDNLDHFPLHGVAVNGARYDTGNPAGYARTWEAYLADPQPFHRAAGL